MALATHEAPLAPPPERDGKPDDASLAARAAAGERDAFALLYERHARALYGTALALCRDPHAADELLQEAFVRAYRNMARVRLDPGASLRPWLHRILINLAYDWADRQRTASAFIERSAAQLVPAALVSPERQLEAAEQQRAVLEAVAGLPFKQRVVVVLFYLHEMDLVEISETLGLPEGTVKSRLYYGRARLRELLSSDRRLTPVLEARHADA